jgi:hypothetical protein
MRIRRGAASRALGLSIGSAVLLVVLGCSGDDGMGKRYKVTGKVTYQGQSVEKGTISFVPTVQGSQGAQGEIEKGSYSLMTLSPGDGALPGEYKVTISARQFDEAAAKAATEEQAKKKGVSGGYSMIPQDIQAKFMKSAKSTTPAKYETVSDQNELKATVTTGSNAIDFDLKD